MPSELITQNTKWTCPLGVTNLLVECWGGGGAGGGVVGRYSTGGGGAGGAYARRQLSVVPGTEYDIIVGWGGEGNGATGAPGGASYFDNPKVVFAEGGNGGGGAPDNYINSSPALGSSLNSIGDLVSAGGSGSYGDFIRLYSGAGGGAAGLSTDGGNAVKAYGGKGILPYGGNGADGAFEYANGLNGFIYGGAGSGGILSGKEGSSSSDSREDPLRIGYVLGGNGAQGAVLLTYEFEGAVELSTTFVNEGSRFLAELTIYKSLGLSVNFVNLPSQFVVAISKGQPLDNDIKVGNIKLTSQGLIKHWWKLNYPHQN